MQIRVVRLNTRNPIVGALLLVVVMALLAFLLTAGMALVAGGAVLGGVGYALRRVLGGKSLGEAPAGRRPRLEGLGEEVFPPGSRPASHRLPEGSPE